MVGVVERVLGGLIILDSGEVDTAPLEENQREGHVSCYLLFTSRQKGGRVGSLKETCRKQTQCL